MSERPIIEPLAWRERVAHITLAAIVVIAAGVSIAMPHYRWLVGYGLYAIPAHLLISFLPNEPALLYVAKLYAPPLVASVGTIACAAAAVFDYWLVGWFVSRGLVRSKLDESRVYRIAHKIFRKAPFLLIVGSAFFPMPFYPVKILAIASGYSLALFIAAVVLGRWPRFYLLAIGGRQVQAPNSWLLGAAVVLELLLVFGMLRTRGSRTPSS